MILRLFQLLFACAFLGNAFAENLYTVYIPKIIRPGFNVSFTATILSGNNVNITARLVSGDGAADLQSVTTVNTGSSERITLGQIPRSYSGSHKFNFTITGVDEVTGETLFTNSTNDFTFASKALTILIQTDKALYQPGQSIKFRAVVLKPDLKPLQGNVRYEVTDPNNNIVMAQDAVLSHGVANDEFQLNKDSVKGNWEISFEALGYKEKMTVEVKLYKLPKFKVEVQVPTFIYPESPGITIKLKATYTYGKPVKGKASIETQLQNTWGGSIYYYRPSIFGPNAPKQGVITNTYKVFNGVETVFIPMANIRTLLGWDGNSKKKITVIGSVTDGQTDITINETVEIKVETTNIKVEELYKPKTIKPGLSYTAYIKVVEQDGKPLMEADRLSHHLVVDLTYNYPRGHRFPEDPGTPSPWYRPSRTEKKTFPIPPDGTVVVKIEAKPDNFTSVNFQAYVNGSDSWRGISFKVDKAQSPSNSYLQLTTDDSNVAPGDNASITIRTTEAVSSFRIIILARGQIMSDLGYMAAAPMHVHNYSFPITADMIPAVQVLVSYVRGDGEIVADFLKLTVSTVLRNKVSVSSSATNVDAGDDVNIRVQTSSAGAYVGMRAIDQSVLLLKSGNDISQERIVNDLNGYSNADGYSSSDIFWRWWWWYPIPSGGKDASDVFSKAGVLVLTDALLFKSEPEYFGYPYYQNRLLGGVPVAFAINPGRSIGPQPAALSRKQASPSAPKPRTLFPETWLWADRITGADGAATFDTKAPDTITSWILSAFSVSDEYGFGLADTFKITVFREFFVSLNLPLRITRGEAIIVQATVFNYFDTPQTVQLTLSQSANFELITPGNDPIAAGPMRTLYVPSNGAVSVKFPVRMNSLGEVPITLSAVAELGQDALTRVVYVRPEGIQQCYSSSILVNRESDRDPTSTEALEILIPVGIVPGSEKVKLSVYGDILGNTLSNLGNLLRMPGGCGEQNMLGFAPDVFVTDYLKKAGRLDAATEAKARSHIRTGYTNELNYKHGDGSYSAFGRGQGSTWLTAFVAKCFIFAHKLQADYVQAKIIDEALDFLISMQNSSTGEYMEKGKVSHRAMQGGVTKGVTMTAYVLVTLTETAFPYKNKKVAESGAKARAYLESNLQGIRDDKYALAIVTYALTVSESNMAGQALGYLNALASVTGGLKYWEAETPDASVYKSAWRRPYYQPPTNEVEMTAYALLTYARMDNVAAAAPIMKWLASKQNPNGGYTSTQDTVIAIQAMSSVAGLLVSRPQALTISATHSIDQSFSADFNINDANSMVFNQVNVPAVDGNVDIRADGTGVGVAQLSVCYNIPNDPFEGEPFACTLETLSASSAMAHVKFCCSLRPEDMNATGMFLFEMTLPNGFTVDEENEKERNRRASRVELESKDGKNSFNVYYDNLDVGETLCANVQLIRFEEVADSQPQPVYAYDYYSPARKVTRLLEIARFRSTQVCQLCGQECVGCPGPQMSGWRPWSVCTDFCRSEMSTRIKQCIDPNNDEVLDIEQCGRVDQPMESRQCPLEGFPCPTFHHGLWTDVPRGLNLGWYYPTTCQSNSRNGATNIPGTHLNKLPRRTSSSSRSRLESISGEHFTCTATVFQNPLNAAGFTVSILVKPAMSFKSVPSTLFSFGTKDRPIYHFGKQFWKDSFKFTLFHGTKAYFVNEIKISKIPVGEWSHLVVTWSPSLGAKVYINGNEAGIPHSYSLFHKFEAKAKSPKFYLGQNTYGNSWRRGYINGSLSSLDYFSRVLNTIEVNALHQFYAPLIGPANPDPEMTPRQLRHFAPRQLNQCFKTQWTLQQLMVTSNVCSVRVPPPPPFPMI